MSRMFGTDGVRGIANTELTADLAYSLGRAGAYVLTEGTHKPKILVAKDTRISGDMLEAALVAGILSVGAEAVILGVVPTPAVAHLTRQYKADAGVMISASHNPVEYNGIKFFDGKGYKLSDSLEDQIQAVIESGFEGVPSPVGGDVGRSYTEETALREYIDYLETNKNWKAITYTTSQYEVNRLSYLSNICLSTAHDVIGQEFDKVVFGMDENFKYDEENKLLSHGSYYSGKGMLYQIVTRVINQLKIVVLDNPDLYCKILEIKTMNE